MIEKNYQPADIEGRMSRIWEEAGAFKAGRPERRHAKPFTIVIPPPNVTGSLHMGHALNNTLQDILCRFERMRGRDVLWQPGTDHAGIATQMVVERQVNWDPKLLTAISDLEVQQVEVKGSLWYLRYPLEGKTFDPEDPASFIVVATTRPETMLGDTAVAAHPDDERYAHLVGKHVILPLVGRKIPIVADEYSDPEKGSGAVKVTPAHDFNDFE